MSLTTRWWAKMRIQQSPPGLVTRPLVYGLFQITKQVVNNSKSNGFFTCLHAQSPVFGPILASWKRLAHVMHSITDCPQVIATVKILSLSERMRLLASGIRRSTQLML